MIVEQPLHSTVGQIELNRMAANLRSIVCSLVDEWPKAVREGKTELWAEAMVDVVSMFKHWHVDASSGD